MYYVNVCVKFDDFFLTARERKSLPLCQLSKKFTVWDAPRRAYLDHSKTLIFSDIIKIKIIFKYLRARAICTSSLPRGFNDFPRVLSFQALAAILDLLTQLASISCWYRSDAASRHFVYACSAEGVFI